MVYLGSALKSLPLGGPMGTVAPTYGCGTKPVTTSTMTNTELAGGSALAQNRTYSYVEFNGYYGSGTGSAAIWMQIDPGTRHGDICNLIFDHCVIKTIPTAAGQGNGIHFWNYDYGDGGKMYNIIFSYCWFEPQPRMAVEINGRRGWWHDVTFDHCTFEPCGSQLFSCDMSPNTQGDTVAPWGATVDGVVRGVESVHLTNCDFQGVGVTVNGWAPMQSMTIEYAAVFPYSLDTSIGRSSFRNNRVGRTLGGGWLNCGYCGTSGVTYQNNLFDWSYNPGGVTGGGGAPLQGTWYNCDWIGNTWNLCPTTNEWPSRLTLSDAKGIGDGCHFESERWIKTTGTVTPCDLLFTNSTFNNCYFDLPTITFDATATGSGNTFVHGQIGGNFS